MSVFCIPADCLHLFRVCHGSISVAAEPQFGSVITPETQMPRTQGAGHLQRFLWYFVHVVIRHHSV
ncbi:hypothetical protein Z946_998 [Sulfitobacter noctilucicola]|nr:hypothetical protein Z946_998 [Sulfitobacter noctilucicola]